MEWRIWTLDQPRNTHGYHLRLELDCSELDDEQMGILKQYGGVKDCFSRDILVPGSMTLHALHYAIQRAFGFSNSHDRFFVFPQNVFTSLTRNDFRSFYELAGVYFQPSLDTSEELFWDDNYKGDVSLNTWLKEKYNGPYRFAAECEHADVCKAIAEKLLEYQLKAGRYSSPHAMMGVLLERLRLEDILLNSDMTATPSLSNAVPVTRELHYYYHVDHWHITIKVVDDSNELAAHPEVIIGEAPLCVDADGLNLWDTHLGVSEYCDFLKAINHGSPAECEKRIDAAKLYGWSSRRKSPRLIL